ncbi:hypothetical protein QYF36_006418 [Acer negundo]|nr:hypothetical protein QYF36_006418 [Acer negundo]
MVHTLWGCHDLIKVGDNCSFLKGLKLINGMHLHDFMLSWLCSFKSHELELLCVIFWRVWFCRNQLIHSPCKADSGDVVMWATIFLDGIIGLGIIIRNKSRKVKADASYKLKAMFSPLMAEAMAVWWGILLAMESGIVIFQIETDSLQVVELVNKEGTQKRAGTNPPSRERNHCLLRTPTPLEVADKFLPKCQCRGSSICITHMMMESILVNVLDRK